jgi:hypothetical protein
MRNALAALVAVSIFFAGTAAASAEPLAGTMLTGTLTTSLDTKTAYAGEDVYAENVSSSDGSIENATMSGTVDRVIPAGQSQAARIRLHFNYLRLPGGRMYAIDGIVTQLQAQTKNNGLKEAGGALAGMLVGNAITKTIFGIAGGGLVGAVGGFLIAKNNRENMTIPANSTVTVRVAGARRQE